jgi:hypothetical protein
MTDGRPTDEPSAAIGRWRREYASRTQIVAVSVGGGADHATLRRIAEEVVVLGDASPEGFRRFLAWVSQSIAMTSRAVAEPALRPVTLTKSLPEGSCSAGAATGGTSEGGRIDERVATFVGRCQQDEKPYLARYEAGSGGRYMLRQTVALKESYFELCGPGGLQTSKIGADRLTGMPGCPRCGARYGLAACRCGGLHCIDGLGAAICPWCGAQSFFEPAEQGAATIDLGRTAG